MVLVIVGSYLAYAFIYRGRNEPPTKRKTTNQEAAYYTLRGQDPDAFPERRADGI